MPGYKVHKKVWIDSPSEADPDGDYGLACGAEYAEKTTEDDKSVTCKRCLKAIGQAAAA